MILNANSIVQHAIQIKNGIMKKYHMCRKNYSWNSRTCICENSRNLKGIVHDLVIVSDEIVNVTYSVSKNVTNTIPKYYTNKCHKCCFCKL